MDRKFDLCTGRDAKGRRWAARVPAGVVRTGMFLRLLGGIFVLVERVEQGGQHGASPVRCGGGAAKRMGGAEP